MPARHIFANVARLSCVCVTVRQHLNFVALPPLSLDDIPTEERDIEVKRADLKKHLTLMDVDGKPT